MRLSGGSGGSFPVPSYIPPAEEIAEAIEEKAEEVIEEIETYWDIIEGYMNQTVYEEKDVCRVWDYSNITATQVGIDPVTGQPIYETMGDKVCASWLEVKVGYFAYIFGAVIAYYIVSSLISLFETYKSRRRLKIAFMKNRVGGMR